MVPFDPRYCSLIARDEGRFFATYRMPAVAPTCYIMRLWGKLQ